MSALSASNLLLLFVAMWFIGVEVEQETSAPPPKKILDPPLIPLQVTK